MDRRLTRKTGIYVVVGLVLVGSVLMLITPDPLFSGLLGAAPAIDSCTTIDQPGRYELTKDITASDENNCIEITASNVILDGRGHAINLDTLTPDRQIGVVVAPSADTDDERLSNVTITNITLTEWNAGISYSKTTDGRITNTNVPSNDFGIDVNESDTVTISNNTASSNNFGIDVYESDTATVSNNTVSSNNFGIRVEGSDTATISNNTASSNGYGINEDRSDNVTVSNNTATNNTIDGIHVGADNATISNNTITNNTDVGIFVGWADNATFSHNTVSSNTNMGLYMRSSDNAMFSHNTVSLNTNMGLYMRSSDNATISRNTITENHVGINITNSSDIRVSENVFTGNTETRVQIDTNSTNSTIADNTFDTVDNGGFKRWVETHSPIYPWGTSMRRVT